MTAKTELFLYHLLWTFETVSRPTFRRIDETFESWAYRNGLLWQIHRLEAAGFLEKQKTPSDVHLFVRLTREGRLRALGGRDPLECWTMPWDGRWRVVLFDLPKKEIALRRRVLRRLTEEGFGCLQGSVWISPRKPQTFDFIGKDKGKGCRQLILLESETHNGQTDRQMVDAAWSFSKINRNYQQHLELLDEFPARSTSAANLLEWSSRENAAWLQSVRMDPLLPKKLWPKGYLGQKAWNARKATMAKAVALQNAIPLS